MFIWKLLIILIVSLVLTPLIMKLSIKLGIVDKPDKRKVHKKLIPRMGGLAIIVSFFVGIIIFKLWDYNYVYSLNLWLVLIGVLLIVILGMLDDKYMLSAKIKFSVQIIATLIVVIGGVEVNVLTLPLFNIGEIDLGIFSIPFTVLWILGITNAMNLIDGLDGLSSGISIISLSSILFISFMTGNQFIYLTSLVLIVSTLGFMKYNFYPAKVFMGDTGSLFLGFMIGMITVISYKDVAVFSVLVPLFVLAVPIGDTILAILRRLINKKPIGEADKNHLHHCLMKIGLSHRSTVLLIYLISITFNVGAVLLSENVVWLTLIVLFVSLVLLEILIESTDIISSDYRPFRNIYYKIGKKKRREMNE